MNELDNTNIAEEANTTSEVEGTEVAKATKERPLGARLGEGIFCVVYLIYTFTLVLLMKKKYEAGIALVGDIHIGSEYMYIYKLGFGYMMGALLVGGDAFHLIPRIIVDFKGSMRKQDFFLGLGNLISSITMTLFYNVLMGMGDTLEYSETEYNLGIEKWILYLTVIRFFILLLPWNKWYTREPNPKWALIRNVPFACIGILTVIGYLRVLSNAHNYPTSFYVGIIILTILSFVCYMPVALHGRENPKLGMLMIPKTICYMILMSLICFY